MGDGGQPKEAKSFKLRIAAYSRPRRRAISGKSILKFTNPLLYQPGKHMIGGCIAPGVGSILWLAGADHLERLLCGCICLIVSPGWPYQRAIYH